MPLLFLTNPFSVDRQILTNLSVVPCQNSTLADPSGYPSLGFAPGSQWAFFLVVASIPFGETVVILLAMVDGIKASVHENVMARSRSAKKRSCIMERFATKITSWLLLLKGSEESRIYEDILWCWCFLWLLILSLEISLSEIVSTRNSEY